MRRGMILSLVGDQKQGRWRGRVELLLVAVLLAAATWFVHATGGTRYPYLHVLYIPVILAAFAAGLPGGILAGIAAGLAVGPWMPLDVASGTPQTTVGWVYRTFFFALVGGLTGGLRTLLRSRLDAVDSLARSLHHVHAHTLEAFARSVALRDEGTGGHCERVALNAYTMGEALGLDPHELRDLYWAGLLHDLGKIAIPENILLKPGPLTEDEMALVRRHTIVGAELLASVAEDYRQIALGVRHHHERWDGTGYPDGLAGPAIPLIARILAVVDVFEALTCDRPYRQAWDPERALAYLREQSGSHFDPALVPVFDNLFRQGRIYTARDPLPSPRQVVHLPFNGVSAVAGGAAADGRRQQVRRRLSFG